MIRLNVTKMTCGHCENAVRRALEAVAGVERVIEVSRERNEVVVEGNPSVEEMIAAIRKEGYEATEVLKDR